MPRPPRYLPVDVPAHLVQRGIDRRNIFLSDTDKAAYVKWLLKAAQRYGLSIHAWVLMTNHVHLLATPLKEKAASKTFQNLGRRYVRYFNYRYCRTGGLFEDRFNSHLVQTRHYFLRCCRYIELNPVRAGLVSDPSDFGWSSYRAHAYGQKMNLWTPHDEYLELGRTPQIRQAAYRELFMEPGMESDIRQSLRKGTALGSEAFRQQIEARSGIMRPRRGRGRPRL